MPRIFDNITEPFLVDALRGALSHAHAADYCVGYFNLRGWRQLHDYVEKWPGGAGNCCRLLVGMQTLPAEELRAALSLSSEPNRMDKCPGKLILDTYDLAKRFRDEGVIVISGFHSPMEQECLRILLRSPHPVIWCLARGLYRQIPSKPGDCRAAVADGRLVMVTPFPDSVRHITAKTATTRNRLVVEMAGAVVVAHAAPGSKMETLCRDILATGKPLYTFDHPANATVIQAGALPITPETNWKRVMTPETV